MHSEVFAYTFGPYEIHQIPALEDNYIYVISRDSKAVVVDPAESASVNTLLMEQQLTLTGILNTHHHFDHVGGNLELATQWQCSVFASLYDQERIPGITAPLTDGASLRLLDTPVQVFEAPGHTLGHILYLLPEVGIAFVGDTLFSLGCGRLFEGSAQQMHHSLQTIASWPPSTRIFCTHEYTEANLSFHKATFPQDPLLSALEAKIEKTRRRGEPTVPMVLKDEITNNLFLRTEDPAVQSALQMTGSEPWKVFQSLREKKDTF